MITSKSPSTLKRDKQRMNLYNLRKNVNILQARVEQLTSENVTSKPASTLSYCRMPNINIESTPVVSSMDPACHKDMNHHMRYVQCRDCYTRPPSRSSISVHPAVLNACYAWFNKPPDQLTPEEVQKYEQFRQFSIQSGDPIETSILFK